VSESLLRDIEQTIFFAALAGVVDRGTPVAADARAMLARVPVDVQRGYGVLCASWPALRRHIARIYKDDWTHAS
jgi:hypothetical protein